MADVFLLGAGFSRAVDESMPLMAQLGDELKLRVHIPDEKEAALNFTDNVELWLTYLSQPHPWLSEHANLRNRALFMEVRAAIRDLLTSKVASVNRRPTPPWLQNLIRFWHMNRSTVITLNYDTLIEDAAGKISIEHADGTVRTIFTESIYPSPLTPLYVRQGGLSFLHELRGSSFRLLKLHGSINWFYSGTNAFPGETVYFADSPEAESSGRSLEDLEGANADLVPLIVPPIAEKTDYFHYNTVRTLWILASNALARAERVFCLGYSLPETDLTLRFWLSGAKRRTERPALALINPDFNIADHFESLLPGCYEIDSRFVGEDNCIQRFVQSLAVPSVPNPASSERPAS